MRQEPGTLSIPCHPGQCDSFHSTGPQIRGPELPLNLSPIHYTSPCFLVYKLDPEISNALPALRSHDLDKPT